ncbi:MAG: protease modulator HflK [Pseudomonadota bacterium]
MRKVVESNELEKHIGFSGTIVPSAFAATAVAAGGVALWSGHHSVAALATWLTLKAMLFLELRSRLAGRHGAGQTTRERTLEPRKFLGSTLVVWLLVTASIGLGYQEPARLPTTTHSVASAIALTIIISFSMGLVAYFTRDSSDAPPEWPELAGWCRATVWIGLAALAPVLLIALGLVGSQKAAVQNIMLLSLVPVLEWLVRTLAAEDRPVSLVTDVRAIPFVFSRLNPLQSVLDRFERKFAIDVRGTWAFSIVRLAIAPLAICLLLFVWLSTSLVTIGTLQVGVQERLGRPVSKAPLGPGFHFKAPWPIDRIHRIDTSRVRTLTLGFAGPKVGTSLLWTRQHAVEEYNLLLGDGRDLVTVNALLYYKVSDPWMWHFGTQNPEEMLRVAAEQAVLMSTVNRSLDDVLSENTTVLAERIEEETRARIGEYAIGAEIIGLSFQGLHPPVVVAEDYQAVVSAQHEREIAILTSRSYEVEALQSARAMALASVSAAEGAASFRVRTALGEADAFDVLQGVQLQYPDSVRQMLHLEAIEEALAGQAFHVIDERIERDGGVLWFEN